MYKYLFSLVLAFISMTSFAGNVTGIVKDSTDSSPLPGVVVNIKNTSFVTQTDADGKYELKGVPNGKFEVVFSYITYQKTTLPLVIKGGADVTLDLLLKPEDNKQLKAVTVSANRNTHTESAVLQEIKNSNTVVSGIGSAQISKTMDRNAADVVKRVPGVTIQDDRFIVVRGLADRYNSVWLNDAGAPSSETDKKAFSFDIIPSGLIDRILIYKTPSPELPGDFAGGMVKVYTTSLVDRDQISVGFQTSSRGYTTGRPFIYTKASSTDWLGFDNGDREMPANTPYKMPTSKDQDLLNSVTKSFKNDWQLKTKNASPDYRFGLAVSNAFNFGKVRLGNTLGVAYSNTNVNYHIHREDWDVKSKSVNYTDQYSANTASVGLMDNLGVAIGNSKIELKTLYSQIGKSSATARANNRDTAGSLGSAADERSYSFAYESRATYTTQLLGTHRSKNDKRKYVWGLGYTDLFKNQPNQRRIKYTKDQAADDSTYQAAVASGVDIYNGGGRFYSQLFEHVYSFNHQFSQQFNLGDKTKIEVNAGNYVEYKSRYYWARELGYTLKLDPHNPTMYDHLRKLPLDQIFGDTTVGEKYKFQMAEATGFYDRYGATNMLIASFLSANVTLWDKLHVVGGARYEDNEQELSLYKSIDTFGAAITKIHTKFWLPSVNAAYNFTDKMLIRAAYGKSLNRPEFREIAPAPYYNFDDRELISGSLYASNFTKDGYLLDVAQIDNYDLRWEWYPSAGEMVQVGGFYKHFANPIQRVIAGGGVDQRNITFLNGHSAECSGIEVDVRKSLSFADDLLKTDVFKDIMVVGNVALTRSKLNMDTTALAGRFGKSTGLLENTAMQGQSPYVYNVGLFYGNDKNGFQASVLYNVFGQRIYALGTTEALEETIIEMPFRSFDMTVSKTFFKHYLLSFGAQNMLNSTTLFMKDMDHDGKIDKLNDKELKSFKPGSYFTVGVKVKF